MPYSLEDVNSGSNGAVNIQQVLLSTLLGNLYVIVSSNLKICVMFNFEISINWINFVKNSVNLNRSADKMLNDCID